MAFAGRVNRRARSDRNHVIYEVLNKKTGDTYVGITFVRPPTRKLTRSKMPIKSALDRFTSHCYRAEKGSKTLFHKNIRQFGKDSFSVSVLEIVRGKSAAHQREIELMHSLQPKLNMTSMLINTSYADN